MNTESHDTIINVGIAGQGRSGYNIHADWLKQAGDKYRIVAVADQLPERRRDAEQEFGARTYTDYTEMLAAGGFDLFVNALPTPLHVPATLQAFEQGYHVLCEKPMAPAVADFDRMTAAATKAGRILAPFQNNRHQPFFVAMQQIVASGVLGQIVQVRSVWSGFGRRWDWQTYQCNLGGCLYNTGPHAVDQALCFFPEDVTPQVFCRMGCYNELGGDANDFCVLNLFTPGGPHVEILLTHYLAYPQGDMYTVNGTRGGLTGDHSRLRWRHFDWDQAPRQETWKPWSQDRRYPHEELPWVEEEWSLDAEHAGKSVGYTLRSYQSGVQYIYDNVYGAITRGEPLLVTPSQVRRQIAVLEEAHRQNPLPRHVSQWP